MNLNLSNKTNKIKPEVLKAYASEVKKALIGAVILLDVIGGTLIPLAYKNGAGWFCIPNLIIDSYIIIQYIKYLKK